MPEYTEAQRQEAIERPRVGDVWALFLAVRVEEVGSTYVWVSALDGRQPVPLRNDRFGAWAAKATLVFREEEGK